MTVKPRYYLTLLFIYLSSTSSCEKNITKTADNFYSRENIESTKGLLEIKSEVVLKELPSFTTFDIIPTDDYLVFSNGTPNPYYFDVFSLKTMEVLGSVITQGGAANELSGVARSNSGMGNSIISYSMESGNYIYKINIDSALYTAKYEIPKTKKLEQYDVFKVSMIKEDTFAMVTIQNDTVFTLTNNNGNIINKYLRYPFQEELSSFQSAIHGLIFQGVLTGSVIQNRAAYFQYNSFNWHIVDFSNPLSPNTVFKHLTSLPKFEDLSRIDDNFREYSVATYESNKNAFVDATSNNEFIYALYSGKSLERYGAEADYGDILIQMDWDGNLINRYKLDTPTKIIAITTDNTLYTIFENRTDNMLLSYQFGNE